MHPTTPRPPLLRRYFTGLAEHAFQVRLGVVDPPMVDYIADLLVRFVHSDAVHRVRDLDGRRLTEVAEMVAESEQRIGCAKREAYRHIGDYILFWTGLYPEAVPRLRGRDTKDRLVDYLEQGKRSYHLASTIPVEETPEENSLLKRLSERFEMCVFGLGELRRELEQSPEERLIIN